MIRIRIESVGEVEVLSLATAVNGRSTVLVDLGTGFRDRYVVWTLSRKDVATCRYCNLQIVRLANESGRWLIANGAFADSPVCRVHHGGGQSHEPWSVKSEYHAFNGDYHGQRMAAEVRFEKRAGYRLDAEATR